LFVAVVMTVVTHHCWFKVHPVVFVCHLLHVYSVPLQAASIQQHAIEARIYAEDPSRNFAPSPGLLKV
jgi:biotin carboxylase